MIAVLEGGLILAGAEAVPANLSAVRAADIRLYVSGRQHFARI